MPEVPRSDTDGDDPSLERSEAAASFDLDRYVQYEARGAAVICDRRDPAAWIRSDAVREVRR